MAKKLLGLSARGKRTRKSGRLTADHDIDYSDIPESTDEELKRARRVGRPKSDKAPRQLIAIRIDPGLLHTLRKMAADHKMPYQSYIHRILEKAARKVA